MTYQRDTTAHNSQSNWEAELRLGFVARRNKTVLAERQQRGPLAVQRPFYPEGDICHAYILHPPGGVVGGDRLTTQLTIDAGASALLTTPGATKFYRSTGPQATQEQHFNVSGTLEWLPQENIFFPAAQSKLTTNIHLATDAAYIGWEVQCLGRPVIGERFTEGGLIFATKLYRERKPLLIDRLQLKGERDLLGAAGLRNQPVIATLLAIPAHSDAIIESQREVLECARVCCESTVLVQGTIGCTLLNNVLVVRYLWSSTAAAHRLLRLVWRGIRPLITGREAATPRIWNT